VAASKFAEIKSMFTPDQVNCMSGLDVHLDDLAYMSAAAGDATYADHANARHVYGHLTGTETPRMPPGGPFWSDGMLAKYQSWMQGGFAP
jgi:hypothetical protein